MHVRFTGSKCCSTSGRGPEVALTSSFNNGRESLKICNVIVQRLRMVSFVDFGSTAINLEASSDVPCNTDRECWEP